MADTQEITLDIHNHKTYDQFYQKQYNKNTKLLFHITKEGEPYDISDTTGTFEMKKPDGTVITNKCTISNSTTYSITVTEQMTSVYGNAIFQITITDNKTSTIISTVTAKMRIDEATVKTDDVVSSSEFNALTDALNTLSSIVPFLGIYGKNLNSISTNCICLTNSSTTNSPSDITGTNSFVITFYYNSTYGAQLAFGCGADKLAIRRKNGSSSYTSWAEIS
jgi:hypothetical protein